MSVNEKCKAKGAEPLGVQVSEEDSSRKAEELIDNLHLRNLLEEEIWLKVLDKLRDNPEDTNSCANATPYFWKLLRAKRVEFLFPKVMVILAGRNEERETYWTRNSDDVTPTPEENEEDEERRTTNDEEDSDAIIWSKAAMNCRLVCRAWNKGVENCYQKGEMTGIAEFVNDPDPRTRLKTYHSDNYQWTNSHYRTLNTRDARQFVEQFQQSHSSGIQATPKNPFIGRYMSFDMVNTGRDGIDTYVPAITNILEMWGQEIWYCKFDLHADSERAAEFYLLLRQWLCLMPNLKYLELFGPEDTCAMSPEYFVENLLPRLEKLEALNLTFVGSRIVNQLLYRNSHISYLKMFQIREVDEEVGRSLTNLKGLNTINSSLGEKIVMECGASLKLSKLTFDTRWDSMKAPNLFQFIQASWSDTLTDLHLRDPFVWETETRLEQSKSLRLDLPRLRSISLIIRGSFFLDFILPTKKCLEHLAVSWHRPENESIEFSERVKSEQIIQFTGYEEKMLESNIWELFPKLKTIRLEDKLYHNVA